MKAYLVRFTYYPKFQNRINDVRHETLLVYAESFDIAKQKICKKYESAEKFINLTIE